jgi:hypothetical protein
VIRGEGTKLNHAQAIHEVVMILRYAAKAAALGVVMGCAVSPITRAAEQVPPAHPAISEDITGVIAQMGKTLSAKDLSFTAKVIRVYLDPSGQPLHIFHTMKVVARRPDRLTIEVSGDDGTHDLFYDGKSVAIFAPESKEYGTIAARADIPSTLDEVTETLNVDFPLAGFLADDPAKAFLSGVIAGWQVGTVQINGVQCLHLFFLLRGGVDVELWAENNSATLPRRLVVTHRLLPGQPNFVAEFSDWNFAAPTDAAFTFQPPAGATRVELGPARVPAVSGPGQDVSK